MVMATLMLILLVLAAVTVSGMREDLFIQNSCPPRERSCKTLSQCSSNLTACFSTNTNLIFTEAIYEIMDMTNDLFVISNVSNLTMTGNNATIRCITRVGFAFINMTNLMIQGL